MKKLKRILSILLIVTMVIPLCSCGKKTNNKKYVTRAEWVTALGQMFGMSQYLDKTKHFSDVEESTELYDYVQACYEWGVLSTNSDKFNPNDVASLGFAVSSLVMIITDGAESSNEAILDKAVSYGLLSLKDDNDKALKRGLKFEEANTLLALAQDIVLQPGTVVKNEISFLEDVKDYSAANDFDVKYVSENKYLVSKKIGKDLAKGNILMVPGELANDIVAVKVVAVSQNADGTYDVTTSVPELDEVVDMIDIEGLRYVEPEYIIPAEGVELIVTDDATSTATSSGGRTVASNGKTYEFKTTFKSNGEIKLNGSVKDEYGLVQGLGISSDGTINTSSLFEGMFKSDIVTEVKPSDNAVSTMMNVAKEYGVEMPDVSKSSGTQLLSNYSNGLINNASIKELAKDKNALKDVMKANDKAAQPAKPYKTGYEINVSAKLSNFAVVPELHYSFWEGLKKAHASVTTTADYSMSVSLKGKISGQYKLADVKIPIAGPVSLDVKVYVYFDLNGEISLTLGYSFSNEVTVYGDKSPKQTTKVERDADLDLKVELEVGGIVSLGASILGLEIVSVGIKVGAGASIEAGYSIEPTLTVSDTEVRLDQTYKITSKCAWYLPIIKIQINKNPGNVLAKLGVSAEIDVINKKTLENGTPLGLYKAIENEASITYSIVCPLTKEEETRGDYIGNYIATEHIMYSVEAGKTVTIKLDNIPEGYTEADMVWGTSDSNIVTVNSKGEVTGIADGVANVQISTKDNKYTASCVVSVIE